MSREKTLDNKVIDFLKSKSCWCIKYWGGSRFTKVGIPDILACVDGQFLGIEDKSEKGKPTLIQLVTLKHIRFAGGFGILLYPKEFQNFKRFVEDFFTSESLTPHQLKWYEKNLQLQNEWYKKLEKS